MFSLVRNITYIANRGESMLQVFVTEYIRPENKQYIFCKTKDKKIEPNLQNLSS
jgi:hypothetical protein